MKTSNILKSVLLALGTHCFVIDVIGQPCNASFTFTNQQNVFTFQNNSVGSSFTSLWIFGDGAFSSQQNPGHTYVTTGTGSYTVSLLISDTSGCRDTTYAIINVPNSNSCNASFYNSPTYGPSRFVSNSAGSNLAQHWDLGDGTVVDLLTSSAVAVSHVFIPGSHTVCLHIQNSSGCYDDSCNTFSITENCPTLVNFNHYAYSNVDSFYLNANAFSGNGLYGNTIKLLFDYGDGSTLDTITISPDSNNYIPPDAWRYNGSGHAYSSPGRYNVCMTMLIYTNGTLVCNQTHCDSVNTASFCTASFQYSINQQRPNQYYFQNNSTGNSLTYHWDFGDGDSSTSEKPSHVYMPNASYPVRLIISNTFGCSDTANSSITVPLPGCNASISYTSDDLTYFFQNHSTGYNFSYLWNFGNGATSTDWNPVYSYPTSGIYNTCLFISDTTGCSDTTCTIIFTPCTQTTLIQQQQCTDDTVLLNLPDNCLPLNHASETYSKTMGRVLFFSDNSPTYPNNTGVFPGQCRKITNVRVEATFFDFEAFPIYADIYLRNQYMGTVNVPDAKLSNNPPVSVNPPLISLWNADGGWYSKWIFSINSWYGTDPANLNWFIHAINHGGDTDYWESYKIFITYNWDGSGSSGTFSTDTLLAANGCDSVVITQTTYVPLKTDSVQISICESDSIYAGGAFQTQVGIYSDTFTTSNGCDSILTTELTVIPAAQCSASCNASFAYTNQQNVYTFQSTSTGNMLNYFWTFGDGNTSSQQNPTHTYTIPGTYNVCLAITHTSGCSDTTCSVVTVLPTGSCSASFTYTNSQTNFTFQNTSTGSNLSYLWLFGDGISSTLQNPVHPYASGIYNVCLIITTSGCSDTTCTIVTAASNQNLVWPGDANADGIANVWDVLAIGIGYGISSSARPNATTNWVGQPATDWQLQFISGVNLKHADCNGNALIDSSDVGVIGLNYGLTHQKGGDPNHAIDPDLYFAFPQDSANTGDTIVGSIYLGTSTNPITNIYCIAFSLLYNSNIIDSGSLRIDFTDSWFTPNANRISLTKDLFLASKMDAGISRIDHTNISGAGKIADVSFVIQDNIDGKDYFVLPLEIQFENVLAIDKDEAAVSLSANGDTLYVKDEISSLWQINQRNDVRIFPNPAANQLYVVADFSIAEYRLLDLARRDVIKPVSSIQATNTVTIDLSAVEPGAYLIQLKNTGNYSVCRKIVVMK